MLVSLLKDVEEHSNDDRYHVALIQFLEEQVPEFSTMVQKEIEKTQYQFKESLTELERS